jgi:hypothetical protein
MKNSFEYYIFLRIPEHTNEHTSMQKSLQLVGNQKRKPVNEYDSSVPMSCRIPRKVIGKFSLRIVPNQTPDLIEKYVCDHINAEWAKRGSPNTMKVKKIFEAFVQIEVNVFFL